MMRFVARYAVWAAVALCAGSAFAEGVLTPAAGPLGGSPCDNARTMVCLKDEFWGGTLSTGLIGELGWNLFGGNVSTCGSIAGDPGCYSVTTTNAPGNVTTMYTQGSSSVFAPGSWDISWRVQLVQVDANTTFHVGMQDSVTTVTPTNGSYIQRLDGDTNLYCVTRAAGVETRTDSGVAASTNNIWVRQVRTSSALVQFYINDVLVCSHTTNIHSTNTNTVLAIKTSAAAAKTINARFFSLKAEVAR